MRVLVTGGAGYIGSHTCLELLQAGYDVIVVDNLANSKVEALQRVQELADHTLTFHQVDLLDPEALDAVFALAPIDAVMHFAGLKAVAESMSQPLHYFAHNVGGTVNLLQAMDRAEVRRIVFSSNRSDLYQIYVMDADGSNARRVVESQAIDVSGVTNTAL